MVTVFRFNKGMPGFSIEHMQVKLQRLYSIPFLSFVGIIEKLSQIDGVLRVREAKVIKLIED